MTGQTGNNKPNDAEGLAFPLSGNEKLIEEAKHLIEQAGSFREQVGDDASPTSMIGLWLRTADALHAALAEFEKALTPTEDEREALARWLHLRFSHAAPISQSSTWEGLSDRFKAAWLDLAGDAPHFHHSVVPEPQSEPSDVQEAVDRLDQCLANRDAGVGAWSMVRPEDVRTVLAALRAAGGVR